MMENKEYLPDSAYALITTQSDLIAENHTVSDLLGDREWWGAIFEKDPNPKYRYMLWRIWQKDLPLFVIFMLNPSTADHLENDTTVTGIMGKARTLGFGGILVINLFAYRATSPEDMKKQKNPKGDHNDLVIKTVLEQNPEYILCAWGTHGNHQNRDKEAICAIKKAKAKPFALRLSKHGMPEHPLYKKLELMPGPWDIDGGAILR